MIYTRYFDVIKMYQACYQVLLENEVVNMIALDIIKKGYESKINGQEVKGWRNPDQWYMATVSDDQNGYLVAIMTPPYDLIVYKSNKDNLDSLDAFELLIDQIIASQIEIPGIIAIRMIAEQFATIYQSKVDVKVEVECLQGIYQLTEVNQEVISHHHFRSFQVTDLSFIPYWRNSAISDFYHQPIDPVSNKDQVEELINEFKDYYILEDQKMPVAMASINRKLNNCCCISMVYTPPYFRNKGYSTSLVALMSQKMLDQGYQKIGLYTDLDNPISNHVYQKIGYNLVSYSNQLKFIKI